MYEWDDNKNKTNTEKHGLSFEEASKVFDDEYLLTFEDSRRNYGESRYISIGRIKHFTTLIIVVVHTDRKGRIRIISARKASKKEKKLYEQQI